MAPEEPLLETLIVYLLDNGLGTTFNWRPICKQEQTTTSESMDALSDIFDFLMENAPVAVAVGGVAASTALVANPSLPMTDSNGVPPGKYIYLFLLITYVHCYS